VWLPQQDTPLFLNSSRTQVLTIPQTHLAQIGLSHAIDGFQLVTAEARPRKYRQLVASRFAVQTSECTAPVPWPEAVVPVTIELPSSSIELYNCHIPPGSSYGWIKVETFEGIYRLLSKPSNRLRILCGDFNTPQRELLDGTVITWGQRIRKDGSVVRKQRIRGKPGARWDAAERSVLTGLAEYDLHDVFRKLHGYDVADFSWRLHRKGATVDRRFDHVFASATLNPVACRYLHRLREAGLSDHSAIEVVFEPVEQ
jgi:endonuclease/exonuclease/phosphatase family metal-dependent hydrolase